MIWFAHAASQICRQRTNTAEQGSVRSVAARDVSCADTAPTWLARFITAMGGRRGATVGRMIELVGDSSRDGEWALVRLRVDGDTIVEADAPGLSRDLEGLTLLEAAAVPGETLATDALANAIGPVVRGAADPRRVAVAMSGGVDSAVALLHAGPIGRWRDAQALARSGRSECRARVLLARRRDRGPRGMSRARAPARHARPPGGVQARDRRALRAWL